MIIESNVNIAAIIHRNFLNELCVVSDITILAANIQSLDEWVFDITSQTITENVGVAVTQNEWILTITSQVIAATALLSPLQFQQRHPNASHFRTLTRPYRVHYFHNQKDGNLQQDTNFIETINSPIEISNQVPAMRNKANVILEGGFKSTNVAVVTLFKPMFQDVAISVLHPTTLQACASTLHVLSVVIGDETNIVYNPDCT